MKFIAVFSLLLISTLSGDFAYAESLRVGVSTGYPPVIFKENGKVLGIESDLAKNVGDITGMTIKFVDMPWDKLEHALNKGDIDVIMSGVSVTDKRKKRVDFTNPYMSVGQMVLINADNIMSHASKMSMYSSGKRFGVEKNTTGEKFVKSEFSGSKIYFFKTVEQGIKALKSDKVDYFIHDAPTIWQYTVLPRTQDKSLFGLYEYMTTEPLAWAVKKGNNSLLEKLNNALSTLQNKGLVIKTVNHWLPLTIEVGN
ncbi:MAG: transporter substrate-binding domain-containing protein [gamma proteobacterium symbiont of Bathyaustriella thionipta]|nr:transporter substrate-binding domain-containing protein [gamma proteobacterium symbiont of Bathyaustriella thionipta]MCU7951441.1 transporter substrate-binding domain-containing protein [gamma proteobacterium symbiont of Bathyaustriella thionipta]MCU7954744.1 transporter substrate-binding domain-containing protein [gamma proteobacterium symbiont of Bathyaustriella thionipta]MCU7958012.1 transporter substrate-binding domain-containing protein [gamma proteobacterium symbiont of Bathyaustriella 